MKKEIIFNICLCLSSLYADDWEHFQGPKLDGISYESGLKSTGLKQIWKSNIKTGFSSLTIVNGIVYSMGNEGDEDIVFALDSNTGKTIWENAFNSPLTPNQYEGGPNSTPTYHDGKLYVLSKEGLVLCFDALTGKEIWSQDCRNFGAIKPKWGYAGSPTILNDLVVVNVGDSGAAFDKNSGKVLWTSSGKLAGYASIFPLSDREVLVFCGNSYKGVDVESGKVNWIEEFPASYRVNAATPLFIEDKVLLSTGYGEGRSVLIDVSENKPKELWRSTELKAQFSNPIYLNGYIYGISGVNGKSSKLKCLDAKNGEMVWEKRCKFGSLRATEDKLYFLNEKGLLTVLKASPIGYQEISSSQILDNRCWTPPAISNGILYARDAMGDVVAINLKD